jgi:hypothetical protein
MLTTALRILGLALTAAVALSRPAVAQMPCQNDFVPLRTAVEKEGTLVKAAIDHKAGREVVCERLKKFVSVEDKFVRYIVANQQWCGIPPTAVKQVTESHEHSTKLRNQACNGGGQARAVPQGPGLSEALGTSRAPNANTTKTGSGTFDTLTGNPLR